MDSVKRIFWAVFVAFILNVFWELSHYFLYVDLSGIPKYPHLLLASFADALIILGIFLAVSLKNRNFLWIKSPERLDYLLVGASGILIAILIEKINLGLGRWGYTSAMPLVFGVGLSPLVQLALTGIFSLAITAHFEKYSGRASNLLIYPI